jgi:hypothetical protein
VEDDLARTFRYRHAVTGADLAMHARWRERPRLRVGLLGSDRIVTPALEAMLTTGGHQVVKGSTAMAEVDAVVLFAGWASSASAKSGDLRGSLAESIALSTLVQVEDARSAPPPDLDLSGLDAGVRRVVARPGLVLSPRAGLLSRMLLLSQLRIRGNIPEGGRTLSWIAADDAAAGILRILMEADLKGEVTLASPQRVTVDDLWRRVRDVTGRLATLPLPSGLVARALGEAVRRLEAASSLGGKQESAGPSLRHPELDGALRHLLGIDDRQ